MLHAYLGDAKFWRVLELIDEELAATRRAEGCAHCGGVLHRSDYPRKPRGVPRTVLGEGYARRLSLCCASEGCRRRATPASVRFLARRAYLGALVVLLSALAEGLSVRRHAVLCEQFGVSVRTLRRWQRWWRERVPSSPWWRAARGEFVSPPTPARLPGALLEHAGERGAPAALVGTLRWLSPLSRPVQAW